MLVENLSHIKLWKRHKLAIEILHILALEFDDPWNYQKRLFIESENLELYELL